MQALRSLLYEGNGYAKAKVVVFAKIANTIDIYISGAGTVENITARRWLSIVGRLWPLSCKTLAKHGDSAPFYLDSNNGAAWFYHG